MSCSNDILRELRTEVKKRGVYEIARQTQLQPKTIYNFLRPAARPSIHATYLIATAMGKKLSLVPADVTAP